jgi:hypothetical protein
MGSKFHATCAAVFLASAMGFAGVGLAATTASDSGSGRDSIGHRQECRRRCEDEHVQPGRQSQSRDQSKG